MNRNLLNTVNLEINNITFLDKIYFTLPNPPNINELYHSIMNVINAQIIVFNILSSRLQINNSNRFHQKLDDSYFQ